MQRNVEAFISENEDSGDEPSHDSCASTILRDAPFSTQIVVPRRRRDKKEMSKSLVEAMENTQSDSICDEALWASIMLRHPEFKP